MKCAKHLEEYKGKRQRVSILSPCNLAKTTWTQITVMHHCHVMVYNTKWDTRPRRHHFYSHHIRMERGGLPGGLEQLFRDTPGIYTVWVQFTGTLLSPTEIKIYCWQLKRGHRIWKSDKIMLIKLTGLCS